jgi:hypothetical protein
MARVVFLHPDLGIGGAERLVVDAALALQAKGHQVHTFSIYYVELGICYFFPFSLFRYFNAAIRYRYSATFLNFAIRYSLFSLTSVVGFK